MQPGGYSGYDKGLSVLEKYGLVSENTYRGRGALLCQTQQGLKMIRPYDGPAKRLEKVYELLQHLKETGHSQIDQLLRNEEGNLVTTDKDGVSYIVKDWWDLRECDARSGNDVIKAVRALASVHRDMYLKPESFEGTLNDQQLEFNCPTERNSFEEIYKGKEDDFVENREQQVLGMQEVYQRDNQELQAKGLRDVYQRDNQELQAPDLRDVYRRHNQELKKIREFIRKRKQKNQFEYMCLEHMPRYMEYGQETLRQLNASDYGDMRLADMENGSICHNACTQHNFLMQKTGAILVNYEHYCYDSHMADLAQFMRKVLEKHGWNRSLAEKLICAYDGICPIGAKEQKQLVLRLSYPEKFWKIMNFYYNNSKAFFPEKNVEKLVQQMENEKNWLGFIEHL